MNVWTREYSKSSSNKAKHDVMIDKSIVQSLSQLTFIQDEDGDQDTYAY